MAPVEDYYTTGEAARILKVTEARVRQMLGAGELEGQRDELSERWRIPQHAVHARLEKRRPREAPTSAVDAREWIERVEALQRELGRLEGRLELTEKAESSMREERERLLADLERERVERRRVEEELREARRPWWQRMFGG